MLLNDRLLSMTLLIMICDVMVKIIDITLDLRNNQTKYFLSNDVTDEWIKRFNSSHSSFCSSTRYMSIDVKIVNDIIIAKASSKDDYNALCCHPICDQFKKWLEELIESTNKVVFNSI